MDASARIPLLPSGEVLFDGLPARAVVLEELPPVVGDGAILVRQQEQAGILMVSEAALLDACLVGGGRRLTGEPALSGTRALSEATVTAVRLEPRLVAILSPFVLRGQPCYEDLHLGWTDWHQLLADIERRRGTHLVQINTAEGRGATVIVDGEHVITYADFDRGTGDPSLLDRLGQQPAGTISVHRVADPDTVSPTQVTATAAARAEPASPRLDSEPGAAAPVNREPAALLRPLLPSVQHVTGQATGQERQPPTMPPAEAGGPAGPTGPAGPPPALVTPVRELLPNLKLVARERLHNSAPRVERLLDEAAEEARPLDSVLWDIRRMAIRGVLPSTLDAVADRMLSVALACQARGRLPAAS